MYIILDCKYGNPVMEYEKALWNLLYNTHTIYLGLLINQLHLSNNYIVDFFYMVCL